MAKKEGCKNRTKSLFNYSSITYVIRNVYLKVAAWFTINCLAYNIASSIRAAVSDGNLRTARIKRLRLYLLNIAGRIVRDRRKIRLRLATTAERIALLIALFEKFPLRTVATG